MSEWGQAPRPTYEDMELPVTGFARNASTKAALDLLNGDKTVGEWAANASTSMALAELEATIRKEAKALTEHLLNDYGEHIPPDMAALWIANQIQERMKTLTETFAQEAYRNENSKANIARAVGIRQQNANIRFPHLED